MIAPYDELDLNELADDFDTNIPGLVDVADSLLSYEKRIASPATRDTIKQIRLDLEQKLRDAGVDDWRIQNDDD